MTPQTPATAGGRSPAVASANRGALLAVVLLCGLVRVVHLLAVQGTPAFVEHRIRPATDMYIFDQWAQRIVDGDVLGRTPYHPVLDWMSRVASPAQWTRWFGEAAAFFKAPLYPYLVAMLRARFGDPALPMAVLQIGASMVSALLLFLVGERLFGATAGLLAALVFAVYGPAVHYDAVLLRGPWVVLVALVVTWRLFDLRERLTPPGAAALGGIVGIAILLNEGFVPVPFLVLAAFACWAGGAWRWMAASATFAAGLAIALAPLVARNVAVGAPPLQVAVTGAWVFAVFNAGDADPIIFRSPGRSFVPIMEASEARLLRVAWLCLRSFDGVGQLLGFYLRRAAGLIAPFENADNASFYHAAVGSPLLRWLPDWAWLFPIATLGVLLALATLRWRCLAPLAPVSVVLLVSNLLTAPLSRYRLPLVVLAMPFAGLALERTWRWVTRRRLAAVAVALAAIVALRAGAALAERRLVLTWPEPWMNVYRFTDFNVSATEYAKQERYDAASSEYLALAAHSPRGSLQWVQALLLAAPMQARAGDVAGARASVRTASESAPAAARVWLAIGDIYRTALADPAGAAEAYRRAAELRPTGEVLEALRARTQDLEAHGGDVTPPRPVR